MRYDLLFLFASFGAVYFFAYRFLFHNVLKWKMIHSIWLPLLIEALLVGFALWVAIVPQPAGSWSDLISIVMLIFYSPPVIVFFILYFIYAKRDRRIA